VSDGDVRTVAVVGAAGEMAQTAVRTLARDEALRFVLTDIDEQRLGELATSLPAGRIAVKRTDLFDPAQLRAAIAGADIVLNGAGPFMRTAQPVLESCIAEGVDYLDYDDDPESTAAAIGLEERLAGSGIACFKSCGHSPGMTNVIAVDVASRLDTVERIDVCWALGDEGAYVYGRAVIEHWLDVISGTVPSWRDGRAVEVPAFAASEVYPLAGDLGNFRLHEVGHPEPISLPRIFPDTKVIRCMGGLHPQPANGISKGVAGALAAGRIEREEAITWIQRVFNDESGSLKVWRPALAGMLGQVRRGEVGIGELLSFLSHALRGRHWDWMGAAAVRATGLRDGRRVSVMRRTPAPGPRSTIWSSLASCTGKNAAAFLRQALERPGGARKGLLFPEDWIEPDAHYEALVAIGVRREDVIEAGYIERGQEE
jgi:NAD(P)-dependent dehydrogenase (short-subunit alcohol dehydrogenase family)